VYHQVRVKEFYFLPTRFLCFEWPSEQTAKEERKKKVKNEKGVVEWHFYKEEKKSSALSEGSRASPACPSCMKMKI